MFGRSNIDREWRSYEDQELWLMFSSGRRKPLAVLFLRFYDNLYRYGMSFHPSEQIVKDSIQTLFLRLWSKKGKLETPTSVKAYLLVSLRRIILRDKKKSASMDARHDIFLDRTKNLAFTAENRIIAQEDEEERINLFQSALKYLTSRQKRALLLRLDSGLSNQEIADVMDISNKSVRNLIYEATKRLKKEVYKLKQL